MGVYQVLEEGEIAAYGPILCWANQESGNIRLEITPTTSLEAKVDSFRAWELFHLCGSDRDSSNARSLRVSAAAADVSAYRIGNDNAPCPWPVVGNLGQVKPARFLCFAEWAQMYGPIILVWFRSALNVIVSNSEPAREVRKICTVELFSAKSLESLQPIREDEVNAMVESIFAGCTDPGMLNARNMHNHLEKGPSLKA
ncbi:hypothetical protein MLD38_007634 [Melastoma candidum]|uniref:Uncharacterized protein n=1 Tax=Melastoma candidum TaxID=119954 RepID=A0ACB9RW09_9MYRT|nr:hypothetical protein MLD38_007634 [Melastoma candidum]